MSSRPRIAQRKAAVRSANSKRNIQPARGAGGLSWIRSSGGEKSAGSALMVVHAHLQGLAGGEIEHFVDRQAFRQLVRDEEDGRRAFQLVHRMSELLGGRRVEAARGLVEHQDARALQRSARDGE